MLDKLRALAPRQTGYALGTKIAEVLMARGWGVILLAEVVERSYEGL